MKRNAAILLSLLLLIGLPPVGLAYFNRFQAEALRQTAPARASRHYEIAAHLLFWEAGLREQAALSALQAGEDKRALALLLEARRAETLTPSGWLALGEIYARQGDWDAAYAQAWLPLWQTGFASPALFARLAEYAAQRQDAALEVRALTRLLELDPARASARYRLALLLAPEDLQTALTHLSMLTDPSAETVRNALQQALMQEDPAYRALLVGRALANADEWPLALRAFRAAAEFNPNYAEAWAWQAEALYQMAADPVVIEALYDRALALNPQSAGVQAMAGLYYERQGNYAQAESQYLRAAQLEPENPAWRLALARIIARRDLPAALEHYQAATRIAPQDVSVWMSLAAFCLEHEAFLEEVGLEAALRAYALAPQNPAVLDLLGRMLALTGEAETARVLYQRALDLDPALPAPRFHLALLYLQTGRVVEARTEFEQVTRLDPAGPYGRQAQEILTRYFSP
ncbi:MAG: tetratricopeptide repeat protein [Anaerolineales bacterium]|nr:tetratricopeptide repeat protein [Anaerolineales bacterium]